MKQQIVVIHGGNAYENYNEFLEQLKLKEVDLEKLLFVGWRENLQKDLGEKFEVILPKMPNPENAKYEEWKIWFDKIKPLLYENVILIGHSLGGIFLAKYLSENNLGKKIRALFLIAAPYQTSETESLADFTLTTSLEEISNQADKIILYHSKDDPVVPFDNLSFYQKELPKAESKVFTNRNHFHLEHFPELIQVIKELK